MCPRKIHAGSAKRKVKTRESCWVIDLGRRGLVRYMLYQSVGIQVANSLSGHAAYIITPSQIAPAASPQVVGGGVDGRAFHSGPLRFKDTSF